MNELEKFADTHDENRTICEFIEWLEEQKLEICKLEECAAGVDRVPIMERSEYLVARYLGIDLKKLDKERWRLQERQRKLNEAKA